MLFANPSFEFVRDYIGRAKFSLFRNNMTLNNIGGVYVLKAVSSNGERQICDISEADWQQQIRQPMNRLGSSDTRPKLFFLYLYLRRRNLLQSLKLAFIDLGIPSNSPSLTFC